MKSNFPHVGLAKICGWFGITRQAYYQNNWGGILKTIQEDLVIKKIKSIRENHPRIGTRKLYEMSRPFLLEHNIKIGRDALFTLLSANHLLIRRGKRRVQTTNSYHWLRKYPNLIRGFVPTASNQLWVSDITYWKINTGDHLYISFITDVYSHQIVGYQVAETLEAIESIKALKMALFTLGKQNHFNLTHHSDRGLQYCSSAYVKLLTDYNVQISMTENGDPLENAVAERVNGIIKGEYLENYDIENIKQAKERLKLVIKLYNTERPHMSISNLTPDYIHQSKSNTKLKKLWKNYYRKSPETANQLQD